MNQPSIAILTWGLKGGSLANYTAALTQGLWDAGVKEIYLFYVADGPSNYVSLPEGVKLVPLGANRSRWMPIYLARRIREIQPDFLISVSTFINIPAILGWLLSGKGKTKLIVSEHSTLSYKAQVELKHDLRVRLQPALVRLLYPFASGLHANSDVVLEDLLHTIRVRVPEDRAIATPNPVNIEAITQFSQAEPEHPWLTHKNKPVIISVGRLAKQKNFPLLLKVFAEIRNTIDARLIICGEGPERSNLEQSIRALGIEEAVSLPGFLPNPWCHMAKSDVFVLPSEEEPFGLVLVEAMISGVPVIATDALGGGPRSVLDKGKYGVLVSENDADGLKEAILKVLTQPDVRCHFQAMGKERCQVFKPQMIAQQWLTFLERFTPVQYPCTPVELGESQ